MVLVGRRELQRRRDAGAAAAAWSSLVTRIWQSMIRASRCSVGEGGEAALLLMLLLLLLYRTAGTSVVIGWERSGVAAWR